MFHSPLQILESQYQPGRGTDNKEVRESHVNGQDEAIIRLESAHLFFHRSVSYHDVAVSQGSYFLFDDPGSSRSRLSPALHNSLGVNETVPDLHGDRYSCRYGIPRHRF